MLSLVKVLGDTEAEGFDGCLAACEDAASACAELFPEDDEEGDMETKRNLPRGQTRELAFTGTIVEGGLVVFATSAAVPNGDILDLESLNLDRLRANPVLLWNHETYSPPIGSFDPELLRIEDHETYKRALFQPVFHALTERAKEVSALWAAGVLKTVSVAFMFGQSPGDVQWRSDLPKDHPLYGPRGYVYRNARAYEISVVTVPMDDKAMKIGRSASMRRSGSGVAVQIDTKALAGEVAEELVRRGVIVPKAAESKPTPKPGDWW